MSLNHEQFKKYFNEHFSSIFDELLKENKNNNQKKELEIEIKSPKTEMKGISLEIFDFDKKRFYEFCEPNIEYLNSCARFITINIELKKENWILKFYIE